MHHATTIIASLSRIICLHVIKVFFKITQTVKVPFKFQWKKIKNLTWVLFFHWNFRYSDRGQFKLVWSTRTMQRQRRFDDRNGQKRPIILDREIQKDYSMDKNKGYLSSKSFLRDYFKFKDWWINLFIRLIS